MTDDDRKHWESIVKCNHDVPAIQAADAELKRLRNLEALGVSWVRAQEESQIPWYEGGEPMRRRNELEAELRRRAKEG